MIPTSLTSRAGFAAGFAVCAGLLGFAYYLQYVEQQNPCPLCMVQRVAFYAVAAIFLLAVLHGPKRRGVMVYGLMAFVPAAVGAAVAARHVWLQSLPAHLVPACGPGLEYMLKKFPLARKPGGNFWV
jgi:protein dithiol:quinone oxidoreductase